MAQPDNNADNGASTRTIWVLGALFGAIYFIQGIAEPTEGLIAQPVKSWMRGQEANVREIGLFQFWISIPWLIKPVWGLLIDLVPLPIGRRRGWLLLASAMTTISLSYLYFVPPEPGVLGTLLPWVLIACIGVATADVATDALMVEKGQPLGITGKLQSVQWTCLYAGSMLAAVVGGYLSKWERPDVAFLICAGFMSLTLGLAAFTVREPRYVAPAERSRAALWAAIRSLFHPVVLAVAAYLFLWAFNPFSNVVLQFYMTEQLELSAEQYGHALAMVNWGSLLGAFAYGFYCRRVPFPWLVHVSIVAGVAATAAYWCLDGAVSALIVSFFVGLTYMSGTMIQLDLAARVCPPAAAGTIFALLMSVSNAGLSTAGLFGGDWYEQWSERWGAATAFRLLVGIGTAATAASWLLVPVLNRYAKRQPPATL